MSENVNLLPFPREITFDDDIFQITSDALLVIDCPHPGELLFAGQRLIAAVEKFCDQSWQLVAGTAVPPSQAAAVITVLPGAVQHEQGYQLVVDPSGIAILAASPQGAFYGICTLVQLLQQYGRDLPSMRITDWPDFLKRGVMLDISRDKVPSMETLYQLVDLLASWKINQLQLYTEHTFAYRGHSEVWREASPMTGQDILELDAYCRERFVELVPNQNSFGHMERWLKHESYKQVAICPDGFTSPWGLFVESMTLNPDEPQSLRLVSGLFDELLPHFQSRYFNVGCDETYELGMERSATAVQEKGVGRVYLDFLLAIYREVKARGRIMQFWGDIILEHPQLVPELPRDVFALEWGYEADHPFAEHGALFSKAGIPFYVCPGTSSWNSIAGRTKNALENQLNAARSGLEHGAVGFLNTDWGDNGHWQPLPVSYLGFASGAALSWCLAANENRPIRPALSLFAFADPSGDIGEIAAELGEIYHETGAYLPNGTILFWLLQTRPDDLASARKRLTSGSLEVENFQRTETRLKGVFGRLGAMATDDPQRSLFIRELRWATSLLAHSCRRGIWMLGREQGAEDHDLRRQLMAEAGLLITEFSEIWHTRNRPGGFQDSLKRMEDMRADYGESL